MVTHSRPVCWLERGRSTTGQGPPALLHSAIVSLYALIKMWLPSLM